MWTSSGRRTSRRRGGRNGTSPPMSWPARRSSGRMARRDGIAALVMLLGAGAVVWEAAKLPFGVVRNPGPGFVPWWVALVLAALSALLGVQALRARRTGGPAEGARRGRGGPGPPRLP